MNEKVLIQLNPDITHVLDINNFQINMAFISFLGFFDQSTKKRYSKTSKFADFGTDQNTANYESANYGAK